MITAMENLNLSAKLYNNSIQATDEMSELLTCFNASTECLNNASILFSLCELYQSNADGVKEFVQNIFPSTEVNLVSIGITIIKHIYLTCRWILRLLGKIIKFVTNLFKDDINDVQKKLIKIQKLIPLAQNDMIAIGYKRSDTELAVRITEEHLRELSDLPNTTGMTIKKYIKDYINDFNSRVSDFARVDSDGRLVARPGSAKAYKLNLLGYTDAASIHQTGDVIKQAIVKLKDKSKELKKLGQPIKRIMQECEYRGKQAPLEYARREGPGVASAWCKCAILIHDIRLMHTQEVIYCKMVNSIYKVCGKYVEEV